MATSGGKTSRRQEYAQATRLAIVDAGRKLFAERGYFATKVDDIASEARVAPATVYSVVGGKQALLDELITTWVSDPVVATTTASILESTDPVAVIKKLAAGTRTHRESYEDIIRLVLTTAPHDSEVSERLRQITDAYRGAIIPVGEHLAELGSLRPGVDAAYAIDMLWFYFGYYSYFTLHDDNGWSYEQAAEWLAEQACRELLANPPRRRKTPSADSGSLSGGGRI